MMLDKANVFSDKQSIAAVASTVLCSKSVDLGSLTEVDSKGNLVLNDIGRSLIDLFVQITTAVTSGGAATIDFQLIQADDEGLTTNVEVLQSTGALAIAGLTVGKQIKLGLPPGFTKRYMGLQYVIATATTTAGNVFAALIPNKDARPSNPTV
ncbi:MAG: hypothetical protein Q8L48_16760 [Archangium sp.]|nr:hypothetical protein [Archangium sp.]